MLILSSHLVFPASKQDGTHFHDLFSQKCLLLDYLQQNVQTTTYCHIICADFFFPTRQSHLNKTKINFRSKARTFKSCPVISWCINTFFPHSCIVLFSYNDIFKINMLQDSTKARFLFSLMIFYETLLSCQRSISDVSDTRLCIYVSVQHLV